MALTGSAGGGGRGWWEAAGRVGGRGARALVEGECREIAGGVSEHGREEAEIARRRLALDAEQLGLGRHMRGAIGEPRQCLERGIALALVAGLEVAPQEDARIPDLRRDQAAREGEAFSRIEGGAILVDADRSEEHTSELQSHS